MPLPTSLVVKNGSNTRPCTSGGMPRGELEKRNSDEGARPAAMSTARWQADTPQQSRERQRPFTIHRIARVHRHVHERRLELADVHLNEQDVCGRPPP